MEIIERRNKDMKLRLCPSSVANIASKTNDAKLVAAVGSHKPQMNSWRSVLHKALIMLTTQALRTMARSSKPEGRPHLEIKIRDMKVQGLYDTGADVSCLSEEIFRKIPPDQRPRRVAGGKTLKSASGNVLQVRGKYGMKIKILLMSIILILKGLKKKIKKVLISDFLIFVKFIKI